MGEVVKSATTRNPVFWVCLSISIALVVAGFLVPPTGKIDGSVLTAVGELFGFATLEVVLIAIRKGVDATLRHGKTEVAIGDMNKQNTQDNGTEPEPEI